MSDLFCLFETGGHMVVDGDYTYLDNKVQNREEEKTKTTTSFSASEDREKAVIVEKRGSFDDKESLRENESESVKLDSIDTPTLTSTTNSSSTPTSNPSLSDTTRLSATAITTAISNQNFFDTAKSTYDIPRLAYVYSVPLTHRMEDGSFIEPEMLDTHRELQMIRKALKDSRKEILFRAEVATVTNFRTLVTLGCRMLHYTGHGIPDALLFENDRGESNALSIKLLSELFKAGGVRTQV